MFIPLHDGQPLRHLRAPVVTFVVLAACIAAWVVPFAGFTAPVDPYLATGFGVVPRVLTGAAYVPVDLAQAPAWITPVTSLFLHSGFAHLAGNMLFLWVFADNVEDDMGHVRFLLFYLACGVAAGLAHVAIDPASVRPLIGASGAISGVVAAYLMLHPNVRIFGLVLKYIPVRLPAWMALGGWIGFQVFMGLFGPDGQVAWFAHLGGLAAGFALTPWFLRPGVSLRARWSG